MHTREIRRFSNFGCYSRRGGTPSDRKETSVIAKDLELLAVPMGQLKLAERNARKGDVEAIKKSYERFGQRKPIVVARGTNEIVAGNHQFLAAQELGWPEIAVVWVDDDPETQAAYAIADNRIGQLGDWDVTALIEAFDIVGAEDLDAAGFSQVDILDFRALADEKLMTAPATSIDGGAVGRNAPGATKGEEVTLDNFIERYAARATRAIVLYYTATDYDDMVHALDALAKRFGLEDNASVVERLVKGAQS